MKVDITQPIKIKKARNDIVRVLGRYDLTLPEVMGVDWLGGFDGDEAAWKAIEPSYRKAQTEVFKRNYPELWRKMKSRRGR